MLPSDSSSNDCMINCLTRATCTCTVMYMYIVIDLYMTDSVHDCTCTRTRTCISHLERVLSTYTSLGTGEALEKVADSARKAVKLIGRTIQTLWRAIPRILLHFFIHKPNMHETYQKKYRILPIFSAGRIRLTLVTTIYHHHQYQL